MTEIETAFPGLHPSKECCYNDRGMSLRNNGNAQYPSRGIA